MSLSAALNAATTGLAVSSRKADITASNISNASTPGYVRRSVLVGESVIGGDGNGAYIIGIERSQDQALSRERRLATSSAARADIISQSYAQLNKEMGETDDDFGLFAAYQSFESDLRDLAVTPESSAYQQAVYNSLTSLTDQFSTLHDAAISQREEADKAIASQVDIVNKALHQINDLNSQITGLANSAEGSAALEDQRQSLLDKISEIIPIKDIPRDNGIINIITDEGVFLLSGSVHELEFTPSGVVAPGQTYDPTTTTGLSGITVGDQNLTPGNGVFGLNAGSISGYFSIRDKIAPEFLEQIDSLAADLVERFSGNSVDPTNGVGAVGILTDNGSAYDPANKAGLSGRLALNDAINPDQGGLLTRFRDGLGATTEGAAGNSDILNNLLDAFTNSNTAPSGSGLLGANSSSELAAGLSSLIGEARIHSESLAASTLSRATTLADEDLATSGVDTDVEMQNLLIIEQAYAANARVIQTVSDMLDILMQL